MLQHFLYYKQNWSSNYWDNWNREIPRPIIGVWKSFILLLRPIRLFIPIGPFPTFQFDWHPAQEPYDIPEMG